MKDILAGMLIGIMALAVISISTILMSLQPTPIRQTQQMHCAKVGDTLIKRGNEVYCEGMQ